VKTETESAPDSDAYKFCFVLFFSRPRDPRVGHTMDVLSPFIAVLPVLLDKSRQVEEQYLNGSCVENLQEVSGNSTAVGKKFPSP